MSDGEAHSHVFIIFKSLAQHLRGNKVGGKARYYWVTKQKKHGKRSAPGLEHILRQALNIFIDLSLLHPSIPVYICIIFIKHGGCFEEIFWILIFSTTSKRVH